MIKIPMIKTMTPPNDAADMTCPVVTAAGLLNAESLIRSAPDVGLRGDGVDDLGVLHLRAGGQSGRGKRARLFSTCSQPSQVLASAALGVRVRKD